MNITPPLDGWCSNVAGLFKRALRTPLGQTAFLIEEARRVGKKWSREIKQHGVSMFVGWGLTFAFAAYVAAALIAHSEYWNRPPVLFLAFWIAGIAFAAVASILLCKRLFSGAVCSQGIRLGGGLGVAVFLIYFVWTLIARPIVPSDVAYQLEQIHRLCFSDWHPIIHTLSLGAIAFIWDSPYAIALVQIGVFAFLVAWLARTMSRFVSRRMALAVVFLVAFNPISFTMLRCLTKDVAFALSALGMTITLVNVVASRGEWLMKKRNCLLFSGLVFLASFYRHNGIFLTMPLCAGLLFWRVPRDVKMRIVLMVVVVAVLSAGYVGVKKSSVMAQRGIIDVRTDEGQRFAEAVGLPMCGMLGAYVNASERTPESTRILIEHFGCRKDLLQIYVGDYNSVKFNAKGLEGGQAIAEATRILTQETTPRGFLTMFLATAKSAPYEVGEGIRRVTAIVWDPLLAGGRSYLMWRVPWDSGLAREGAWPLNVLMDTPAGLLFGSAGLWMLLFVGVATIGFVFRGWTAWLFSVPWLCYGFGTMLLLCGDDWRFFYAVVLCAPVAIVGCIVSRPREQLR